MATEDEAREAADGEEIQVEAGDLGTTHLQMNLDSKLSSHGEMKDEATAMDSTEGMKVSEDQVLERAPSVVEIPQEDTPNGTHASLNGHMQEGKIANEKPQENGQKGNEQVEASPDGISTDQSSTSNGEEAIDSLGHVENTTEGTSLLKHDNEEPKEHCQQDVEGDAIESKMVHKDTLQSDNDVEPIIGAQQGHNLEPAEVTEDTQPATMPCIPGEEVVAEAPAGVQTSLEPNVDEPDTLPDTSDGNTETVEPAKVDKENCPEDEDIEIVKPEDQPSDKTDDVDADMVHEEVPKSKKTDVPEDMPKTGQADESMNGDQEVLNQESTEETSAPLPEKTEETSHESNVSTSKETTPEHDAVTREPALDVQEVQNQGLAEEIADAKEVDTEKTVQQSGIAFEEATPEDNATIVEPSSDIQHLNNVESEEIKGLEDAKAEESSDQSNLTIAEDASQDKEATKDMQPVQGLEEEEPKNTGTVEMDEASSQPHADVINNLAEEDSVPACEPQVIGLKKEVKDTGATETQEITQQSHAAASEELVTEDNSMAIEPSNDDIQQTLEQGSDEVKHAEVSETQEICHERTISAPDDSVKDDATAEGPSCDAQEVENVASVEEIKENTADNIVETSSVATVEEADQENNVPTSEDVSEQQMRGLETEEIQNTEPVETEEASDQRHPALLNDPAQEHSIASDMPKTESTVDVKEMEATKTEALPQESNVSISEPVSEENITASEVNCDDQEVKDLEQAEGVEGNKDTRTKEISDQSNEVFVRDAAQGTSDLAREPAVDMQSVQELQSEKKNAEFTEVSEASGQLDAAFIENPTHEDNLTTSESLVMEPAEVSSNEATEGQGMPQSDATQSEDHKTEENMAVSEPQILEPEPVEEMRDSEATETRAIPQESMSVPEEDVTAKEAASDIKEVQTEELIEEPDNVKAEEISNQSSGTIVEETAQEHKLLSSDPTSDVQAKELESQKISNTDDVETEEASHKTHAEENFKENEPQIATEDNTAILTDVRIQQLQEQEPVEFRDTEATEPQGISTSHTASGSEQSTPEDNEMTEPSPATQAENLESAIVREESEDVKSTDAIAEEETPREQVQESEAHVDIPPVENTEPVEVHDNVTTDDLPAEEVKDNEAIEVAEIHYESPVANIGDLTEDAKSNVALEDEAAPDEDVKTEATAAIPQPQEPELEEIKNSEPVEMEENIIARDLPAEEIKDTEARETEVIPHESTGANISKLMNDVKSDVALADEAAPDEHAKATEATGAIPQPQEPDLEEIKDSEPAEVEGNTSASDLPAEKVKDTEAVETEAINESTHANNRELTEDLQSNVALTDKAAHDEHVAVAETTVDIPQAQKPELEEVKNIEPVEVEETRSASDLPAEEVKETEAINERTVANTSELPEDVTSNVVPADEAAPEEHVIATEATVDIPQAQDPEQEEIKNTEPAEVEENISASDLPAEEGKDAEAKETEVINESTDANISELTEDVKSSVTRADEAAPEEHVIAAEAAVDVPQAQVSEELENVEPDDMKENRSAGDLPAEEVKEIEDKETEAINESTDANISELTGDVTSNVTPTDEAAPEEHVTATEATVGILRAQEPELEEIKNVEPVEVEGNTSASDMPAEEVKDTDAVETEAINESTHANNRELTEDLQSNVALTDEAAHDEHVAVAETTVDIPQAQEPELEEFKNIEPVEVEETRSASDLPAEEVMETEAINKSTVANTSELPEDVTSNVVPADEAAPEEHVIVTEPTVNTPEAQEPELEETKSTEPAEVEENISANDLPAEEVKDTEAVETEAINESTDANNSELPEDVKNNVALADKAAPGEHVTVADDTVDMPQAQEPEVEEIKNTETVEVEENISASDLSTEEVKDTEAINKSADANISELTEEVKCNVDLADEEPHEEHVTVAETAVDIPQSQELELEEIKNTEPVEVEENISASDMQAEEMKDTEAINESTDANISELTEDVKTNVALADEVAPEEHVIATEATVDIPQAQDPKLEEVKNTEPVEVEENISASELPAEEVKDAEAKETEAITESTDANISELTDVKSNVTRADEAAVDIPQAQVSELQELENVEPDEVGENRSAGDLPAEEVKEIEAKETEAINESTDANISELTGDVTSNVTPADEAAPEEHVTATEATVDIPRAQEPELGEIGNVEPVEVEENRSARDLQAEELRETEAINESPDENISELTEDMTSNVAPADEAAPEEHVIATEATVDIPQAPETYLEEIKNTEPVEEEENISASDLLAEEVKDTDTKETEAINESTDANVNEVTEDMKSNVALIDEAAHEEHVTIAEPTVDIPQAQEPELEEIKNTEAGDLSAEEVKEIEPKETEAISGRTDANISELSEAVKSNVVLADEEPHAEHVTVAERAVDIPQAQVPELEEIKNTEPVEVDENRSASDLQAEEVTETEAINESPDANISELTEDVTSNVAPADEAAPEEHVIATEAAVDIPRAQEPDLEEIKNTEPVEVEEFISASDLPTEEVKETETKETEAINESTDANISELTEDVKGNIAHADEAAPEEHVMAAEATDDIPQAQVPELEELENTEPVEVEEKKSATDLPAEEVKDTETMEIEAVDKSADTNISELTEDVTHTDEAAADVQIDVPPAKEPALEEMKNIEPVEAQDGITADNVPAKEINDTEAMETGEIPHESTDDSLTASAALPDIQQVPEQEAVEDKACTDTTENHGEPQQSIVSTSAELTPTEEETAVVEHTQDTHVQNASSEPGSDPNLLVESVHQSELAEDSKGQLVKAEETGQSNGATLEEPTTEDSAANEIGPLADSKQQRGLESVEENKCIDATEGEEASHLSQDPGLEEPVSERDTATVEPTSDIQQVNDMDEAEEMAATEPINGEEISSQKTEVATLEDPSPTDNGTAPEQNPVELDEENLGNEISNAILADENIKEGIQEPTEQKDKSSGLGEKTAFTTQKDESATEEDVVQISGEDTVGTSNNIEQIKELPKSVIEHNAIKSGDHTDDQDGEQLHNVELQMQVCERSVDLSTEQPDDHVQKVNLDQQKKEDEAIEKQTEEIQTDEQKHDDSRADFTTETILEPQSNEIDTTNRKDNADVFEAEQTEAVTTEILKNEQTLHIAQESIPSVTDVKVDNSTEIEETTEQEDAPNNTGTLYTDADAEKYNEDEKENTEIDAAVAKTSTDEQDGTTDETINEEDPTVVPQNVESTVHSEEKECINKANDGMQAIQASSEEIVDEVDKEEIKNEDTNVNHEEIETKLVDEEASGLQDLSFHPKVVDDKFATEQNGAEVGTDSNEEMATGYTAVTESVKRGEAIYDKAGGADVALSDENLETIEDNRRNLEASPAVTTSGESMNEDNEHHKPALPAHSAVDGNETKQASGLEVTERELFPEKPLPNESEEQKESQITKEQDGENVQEQETDDTEKEEKEAEQSYLPVSHFLMNLIMGKESNEPDGNSEFKAEKKQEETTKDGSSLITSQQEESLVPIPTENKVDDERNFEQGKHNIEGSEETHDIKLEKDEELNRDTRDLEAPVCQNNVQGETSSEMVPGGSGLTTEMETRDIKLGEKATNSVCQEHMEATTQIEEGSLKLHDITSPKVSQEDTLEEGITGLQHEPLPENRSSDAVSGQTLLLTEPNMGDEKNLPTDTDDLQSPLSTKREESNESSITEAESTVEAELENGVDKEEKNQQTTTTGGVTEEQIENEHDISQKGTEAISDEQKGEITEPVMGNEINLVHEKGISAGSECKDEKQSSKFSNSELDNSEKALEIQLDGSSLHIDQDKQDESAGDQIVMEKNNLQDKPRESDLQKVQETEVAQESPEEPDEGDQNPLPIREPVIKEVNVNKTVDSHAQTVDTQSQEEQETFNSQVQERDLNVASPEEAPEAEEKIGESKPEFSTDEEQSPKKDESNMAGEKTYDEKTKGAQEAKSLADEAKTKVEEQGVVQKASQNQKRDLDVVLPTEAPGSEENVVDIKEPEFSTDEEESPKKDVSNMAEEKSYEKKTNGDEEAKNFTDDAPMKIEEREAGQKASPKKHNILSGVGSKVKHQLAKVKKAIIGKPGHTKSESPKA
ncbi:hypothetical protein ACQJBY_038409 [Aegilops geniculata]